MVTTRRKIASKPVRPATVFWCSTIALMVVFSSSTSASRQHLSGVHHLPIHIESKAASTEDVMTLPRLDGVSFNTKMLRGKSTPSRTQQLHTKAPADDILKTHSYKDRKRLQQGPRVPRNALHPHWYKVLETHSTSPLQSLIEVLKVTMIASSRTSSDNRRRARRKLPENNSTLDSIDSIDDINIDYRDPQTHPPKGN